MKPLYEESDQKFKNEEDLEDVIDGVRGLILIFKKKMWCMPSKHAIRAYQILMSALEFHYRLPHILENVPIIRKLVIFPYTLF